jgi:CTP synthase
VGDIESQPFLEALRQLRAELPREDTLCIHVTFLPYIGATQELKTKPTQHSVRELRSLGIHPQVIIPRSDHPVSEDIVDKIARFCDVEVEGVVPLVTVRSIYEVPGILEEAGLGDYVLKQLHLEPRKADLSGWQKVVKRMLESPRQTRIAIVGKYVELRDAYMSVKEALTHAAAALDHRLEIEWVNAAELEEGKPLDVLGTVQGIVVPGGFGYRGIEGKVMAARFARENKIPYLGLCLGMQVMCIEFARHVLDWEDANSTEFREDSTYPVIDLMADQKNVTEKGGTMRLGIYPCHLQKGTIAHRAYGQDMVEERHRHRWEVNNVFRGDMQAAGMRFSGLSPDRRLVEIAEIVDHPFMLGSQFHPEFLSRPERPHPLFRAFMEAAIAYGKNGSQMLSTRTERKKKSTNGEQV